MTTRSQKRKAVAELASGEFEAFVSGNSQPENLVAGASKSPKIQSEKLEEIKISVRKEIMTYLSKILAENQKEMSRLIAPSLKKPAILQNVEDSDSETKNNHPASTLTPMKPKATTSKTTSISSCNKHSQGAPHRRSETRVEKLKKISN